MVRIMEGANTPPTGDGKSTEGVTIDRYSECTLGEILLRKKTLGCNYAKLSTVWNLRTGYYKRNEFGGWLRP